MSRFVVNWGLPSKKNFEQVICGRRELEYGNYYLFIDSFIDSFIHFLFSIIIKQFNTKIINIKKIKKRKKQYNVRR